MLNEPLTLVPQKLHVGFWHNNHASMWSYSHNSDGVLTRHHEGFCAPYWVAQETHSDQLGRKWTSSIAYCVIDDFGALMEVPYEQPI